MIRAILPAVPLVGLCALGGCRCAETPAPFSCARLQARAAACQTEALAQIKQTLAARKDRDQQFKMFSYRLKKKIRGKRIETQCDKFRAAPGPEYQRRLTALRTCYGKADCAGFVRCLLGP